MKSSLAFAITGFYFILAYLGISHHEIWMDEAQHILLARDSHSLGELIYNARYEGHPLLWNFLVYGIMHLTHSVVCVQLVHIVLSSACVFLILRYSPFSLLVKLLICFGYFMIFEYSVISRNYSLSLLLLLFVLINLWSAKKNYILLFILMALFMNTHAFSGIISVALFFIVWKELRTQSTGTRYACLFIFAAAAFLFLMQVIPPGDHFLLAYNNSGLLSRERLQRIPRLLITGIFPVPDLSHENYWSNNFMFRLNPALLLLLTAFILIVPALLFKSCKNALLVFYLALGGILLFTWLTPLMPAARHGGFVCMVLLAAAWIQKKEKMNNAIPESAGLKNGRLIFFGIILCVQLISGLIFFCLEFTVKFSNAKSVAGFLNTEFSHSDTPLVLTHFTSGPPVALFCERDLYYLETNAPGTFCQWNTHPLFVNDSVFTARLQNQLQKTGKLVLISNQKNTEERILSSKLATLVTLNEIEHFDGGMILNENFRIYLMEKIH